MRHLNPRGAGRHRFVTHDGVGDRPLNIFRTLRPLSGVSVMKSARTISRVVPILGIPLVLGAQDRLRDMPGAAQFQRMAPVYNQTGQQIAASSLSGIAWSADGRSVDYTVGSKRWRFDL